jgi:hypothetical protein
MKEIEAFQGWKGRVFWGGNGRDSTPSTQQQYRLLEIIKYSKF